ncbi:MarR family winged helix-turn-helix transcriptional regulator [Bacillus horti]|uniref:MarR family 2-MHQ and catechol resistance regulon transcriptional repressor n=1 Tax=Caldalkalibacillus horti TaxID=77523 RepID=A0ABT9W2H8_9BACI|nr:MarR family transcriptional regulator [Bacillus horti]MDQ0167457.1 MarR family 2-MHQ and catechol resistance regulon transcriptional repressor [Bacillus horti]
MSEREENVSLKLFVVLSKAAKSILDVAMKDMKKYGMSSSEFMVLEVLYTKGSIPLQQIGEKVLITSGSITYNIDKLERKGLLIRIPCQEDRRVTFAQLTKAGNDLFDEIFPKHTETIHDLLSSLDPEEKKLAIELLKKIGKGVNDSEAS